MIPTTNDILVPSGTWYNLYSLSAIANGTQIVIYNKGSVPFLVASSDSQPTSSVAGVPVYVQTNIVVAGSSDYDWWIYVEYGQALISVQSMDLQKYRQGAAYTTHAHAMGMSHNTAVALNLVPGARRVTALGNNPAIDTSSVPEDIYPVGGLYPWLSRTTAVNISIVSSSVNDTAAGTGCQSVTISGLDINFNEQSEVIATNGTTPVVSVKQYIRINSIAMTSSGSSNTNAGNVDAYNGANILARMPTGKGSPRSSNYTVPAGYTLAVNSIFIGINRPTIKTDATIATYFGSVLGPYRLPLELSMSDSPYRHDIDPPIMLSEKTDFILRGMYVSQSGSDLQGAWNGILYQNSVINAL